VVIDVLLADTVSLPNYTGSPGYGEAFLQRLIGRCGELDVQDCITVARHLVRNGISEEGTGKQLIMGGSHGGFLTVHRELLAALGQSANNQRNFKK
jgi:acylaminoacyl-peptidase